jgi:ATP-binding cassette, subfamily C, bacteriocin exporter
MNSRERVSMKYFNVRQLDQTDCAAACLATISLYYGLDLSISKIRDLCGTDIKGTSVAGLATCAEKLNYEVKCARIDKSKFLNSKLVYPFIAHGIHEGLSHFIVVYKFTKNYVIVGNPASSEKKMKIDNFMDFFDGVIVLLKPNQNFICGKTTGKSMISRFIKLLLPHKRLMIYSIIASAFLTLLGIASNFLIKY